VFNDHLSDTSVIKGVAIIAVLATAAVVTAARSFARAVA
jgi:hypothetical protein